MSERTPADRAELLACPFCGSPAEAFPLNPAIEGNAWAQIRCTNDECGIEAPRAYDDDNPFALAIAAWNTRADHVADVGKMIPSRPDARLREAVEALRDQLEAEAALDAQDARLADEDEDRVFHRTRSRALSSAASRLQHVLAQTKEGEG